MNTNAVIEGILDEFDWERVKLVMNALDWNYSQGSQFKRPTFSQLRNTAKSLLILASESKELPYSTEQGGFLVTCFRKGEFDLYFTATSASSADLQ